VLGRYQAISPLKEFYSRFAKNSIVYFASQVIGKGLYFLITVYLARTLGAQEYGKFAFAIGLVTLLSVISKFGLDLLTSRDVGERPSLAAQYFHASLTLRLALALVFISLVLLLLPLLGKPLEVNRLIVFLAVAAALQSIAGAGTSLFEGLQLFTHRSVLNVCMYGFILLTVVAATYRHPDLILVGPAFILGAVAYFLVTVALGHLKVAPVRLSKDFPFVWKLFRMALPLGLTEVFIGIYYRIDTVLLSLFDTDSIVGWYDAAYTFVYVLRLLPVTAAMVLLPALSNIFPKSQERATHIYKTTVQLSLSFGFLITFFIAVNSGTIVSLVYGNAYGPSADVLRLLIWTCVIMFSNAFQGILLIISEQRVAFFRATAIGAISNLLLNLYFIPKWGMFGAAITTILSEFFVFVACAASLRRFVSFIEHLKMILPPLIVTALLFLFWRFFGSKHPVEANVICFLIYLPVFLLQRRR
jgi:O-antigen/teichoic acid export membrane protein